MGDFSLGIFTSLQFLWWDFKSSPVRSYNKVKLWRDKLLATAEMLQSESQKWKALFTTLRLPYIALTKAGVSPNMAITLLIGGSVAGGTVVTAELLEPPSFSRGDSGIYNAPLDAPIFYEEKFNTLFLALGTTSVGLVEITDTTVGSAFVGSTLPSGQTNPIIIGGMPAVVDPAFTETYLEVGHMIVDRWRCETMTLSNIEAHTLIINANASDGQSIAAVASSVPRNRGINGGNRASDMHSSSSYFDQIKVQATSSGVNGKIDVLRLENLYSRGGGCVLDRIKAGTLEIIFNEIGGDTNLSTKAFQVLNTVKFKTMIATDNTEVSMAIPAIQ